MTVTLKELREYWTVADVMAGHDYLDAFEAARPVGD